MALTLKLSLPISGGRCACSEPRRLTATALQAQRHLQHQRRAVTVTRAGVEMQTVTKETLSLEEFEAMLEEQPATLVDFYATW